MKILIAYHSRSGNNEILARELAKKLDADLEPIIGINQKELKSIIEFLKEGFMSITHKTTEINPTFLNPSKYDLTIICTPVRVGNLPPQTRTYIKMFARNFIHISYASVCASGHNQAAIDEIVEITELKPYPIIEIQTDFSMNNYSRLTVINSKEFQQKINIAVNTILNSYQTFIEKS